MAFIREMKPHWSTMLIFHAVIFIGVNVYAHDTSFFHSHERTSDEFILFETGVVDKNPVVEEFVEADLPPVWNTPANLSVERCISPFPAANGCGHKPSFGNESIIWGDLDTIDRAVVSSNGTVRFGPFFLSRRGHGDEEFHSDKYRITVYSRSPAIYGEGADGQAQFLGADPSFKPIGFREITLEGSEERTVYVTAKFPSVFNAVKIVAELRNEEAHFPGGCQNLPAHSSAPQLLDSECLQLTVNPLAILNIPYVPLAIIYEPPGNCSWANLTQSHTSGVKLSNSREVSTNSRTITDSGFFWDNQSQDFTQKIYQGSDTSLQLSLTFATTMGTLYGTPTGSPGNAACNNDNVQVPARVNAGPGYGERFVLLKSVSFLHWDTDDFFGSALSPIAAPDTTEERLIIVTAEQIRTGVDLPPGLTFTDEERDAILSLSMFSIDSEGSPVANLDSDRFLQIGQPIGLGRAVAIEHRTVNDMVVQTGQSLTSVTKSAIASSESDIAVDLAMQVLQVASSAAASAATSGALNAVMLANDENPQFATSAAKIKLELPVLYTDDGTTTTITTYSNSDLIRSVSDDTVVQEFFIQDTTKGMNVTIYYDRLFGTYAFVEHKEGTGISPPYLDIPSLVWKLANEPVDDGQFVPSKDIREKLESLGATVLDPGSDKDFSTIAGYKKVRMISEVSLDARHPDPIRLPIARNRPVRKMQTLYIARDRKGKAVAQLWITSD